MKKQIALSWSGGKDGCMALHQLVNQGHEVVCLVTTVPLKTDRTFGHDEKIELVNCQAEALGIPIHFIECAFENYTERFLEEINSLKIQLGLTSIAFGDLYMNEHREWGETVAKAAQLEAVYPLWCKQSEALKSLEKFVSSGYKAVVVNIRKDKLTDLWLGKELNQSFITNVLNEDICPMGEEGSYHTFVYDGPLFKKKIEITFGDTIIESENSKRLDMTDWKVVDKLV